MVIMDADLQHPPELVAPHARAARAGLRPGHRAAHPQGRPGRRSLVGPRLLLADQPLVDVELVDGVGDFRLLSRRAVDAVLELPEYNRFSKGLFAWVGFRTATFDVRERGA